MNKNSLDDLYKRISKLGLMIVKRDDMNVFALINYQYIAVPGSASFSGPWSIFAITHELGHYLFHKNSPEWIRNVSSFFNLVSQDTKYYFLSFPIVFIEEIAAWRIGYKVCKEEGINTDGYISNACSSLNTYFKSFLKNLIKISKYLIGLYFSAFFMLRFLQLSSDMNVDLYGIISQFRELVLSSHLTNTDLVSLIFWNLFRLLLFWEASIFGFSMGKRYKNLSKSINGEGVYVGPQNIKI